MARVVDIQVLTRNFDTAVSGASSVSGARELEELSLCVYDELPAVEEEWRAFEQHADGTVFQTFEWLATWQKCIGSRHDVRPAIVVGRNRQGATLFLLPLATQPVAFARELVWLGSELCDYNAPLLAPNFAKVNVAAFAPLWETIAREIRKNPRLHYDLVRLEKMPAMVGTQPNPMLILPKVPHPSGAYLTPLAASWDEFYAAKRSSDTRRRDRTKRKRLAALGELRFIEPDDAAARLRAINTLMHQKAGSFALMGVRNLFDRPGHAEFYRALATDADTAHLVHISQLNVGDEPAAVNFGLRFGRRYYHLLASYTDNLDIARFGPGAAHLHELLRQAIIRGFRCFDFTIGDEKYKRDWCAGRQELYDHVHACTLRGVPIALAVTETQKLKRLIKQTPLLWAGFSRARSMVAQLSRKTPRCRKPRGARMPL